MQFLFFSCRLLRRDKCTFFAAPAHDPVLPQSYFFSSADKTPNTFQHLYSSTGCSSNGIWNPRMRRVVSHNTGHHTCYQICTALETCSHIFPRTCFCQKMTSCWDTWRNRASNMVWISVTDKVVRMHPFWYQLCERWVSNSNQLSGLFPQLVEREARQGESHLTRFLRGWTPFPRKHFYLINWFNRDFW